MQYNLKMKQIRMAKGLKQEDVAAQMNETKRVIGAWERGETAIPFESAFRLCLVLGCTPNDLCGWPKDLNEGRRFNDSFEQELLDCYRACTPRRQDRILDTARDAAEVSKDAAKRDTHQSKQISA